MHRYDTLILGSGYYSAGYAIARGNCMICEEGQTCDTHFYLPLRSFQFREYQPKTEEGKRLHRIFSELSLFSGLQQNTNGFECAFCRYLSERNPELLLKCRVIRAEKSEAGLWDVTMQTNEGLHHVSAETVLDTRDRTGKPFCTALFQTEKFEEVSTQLTEIFPGSHIETAFYPNRYAFHLPADGFDENEIKSYLYNAWSPLVPDAMLLYIAPVFFRNGTNDPGDGGYENPIEAFEAGYLRGKGEE